VCSKTYLHPLKTTYSKYPHLSESGKNPRNYAIDLIDSKIYFFEKNKNIFGFVKNT
jgi:hypothetical protein